MIIIIELNKYSLPLKPLLINLLKALIDLFHFLRGIDLNELILFLKQLQHGFGLVLVYSKPVSDFFQIVFRTVGRVAPGLQPLGHDGFRAVEIDEKGDVAWVLE